MAKLTYLYSSCLIAVADFELHRAAKVVTLLNDQQRLFIYSPFASLETLSQAIHYGNRTREQFFRHYFNRCTHLSGNLPEIICDAHRQSEKYGIVGGWMPVTLLRQLSGARMSFTPLKSRPSRCFAPKI